jgi:hypothetical protein
MICCNAAFLAGIFVGWIIIGIALCIAGALK